MTTITFDFCSSNVILLSLAQIVIVLISMFAKFSASCTFSALTAINRSSANAMALVRFPNSRLSIELKCMFQKPGPQHDP